MKILDINVINFRNIKEKKFEFADTVTYVYGENGSGKTNLLEAIYYLSCGKSFRNVKDSDIRMRETEYFHVDGTV
ncbi:MAG TPA: DNA replication and repair protein RecF, partial [Bacteroidetes bacterium]|nr:DNA replication and repair protein RecF [Bacteroidota bacterium]